MFCAKYAVTEFLSNNGSGLCDPGFYCESGVDSKRPGRNSTGVGGACPKGFYCPQGTDVPRGCPSGTYSNTTGLMNQTQCTPCDHGHYCSGSGLQKPSGKILIMVLVAGPVEKYTLLWTKTLTVINKKQH